MIIILPNGSTTDKLEIQVDTTPVALCADRGGPVRVEGQSLLKLFVICEGESEYKGKPVCSCHECKPSCRGYNA